MTNKYPAFYKFLLIAIVLFIGNSNVSAQTINDGAMRIRPYVWDSWVQEFEDPFQDDEAWFNWFAADNADLDGIGWRNDFGDIYLNGSNFIGWRTINDGGSDDAGPHPLAQLFDQTYGSTPNSVSDLVPAALQIRGRYTGDDCGGQSGCTNGILNCFGDDDDYCYDDVLTTNLNYRFAPPNQTTFFVDIFTSVHGGNLALGNGSNFGASVKVNWTSPIPSAATATASTICTGSSTVLSAPSGAVFGGVYRWYTSGGTFIGQGQSITVSPTTTTTYRVYTSNGGLDGLDFKDITITVIATSSAITNNTISGAALLGPFCASGDPGLITGSNPTVSLPAWSYEWQVSTNGGGSWATVASGTSATLPYTYNPPVTTQTVSYRRLITSGSCDNSSNILTYEVNPSIANNTVTGAQTICGTGVPGPLSGSLPTGGNGVYSYQWESSTNAGGPFNPIFGANTQGYAPGSISTTTYYRRVVTSGPCSNTSAAVQVTVLPVLGGNTIGITSGTNSYCVTSGAIIMGGGTIAGGNGSYSYQWEVSSDLGNTWTNATGGTGPSLSVSGLTQTSYFRRIVTSSSCVNVSNNIIINVYSAISNNTIGSDQNSCGPFIPAQFIGTTPADGTGSYTYQWQFSTTSASGPWTNVASGGTSQNYQAPTVTSTRWYQRVVTSGPCSDPSNAILITVTPVITNNAIGSDQVFCGPTDADPLLGTTPGGGTGTFNYTWESSTDGINWTPVGFAADYDPNILTVTTFFRRVVTSGFCTSTSNFVTVTIVPVIINNSILADQGFCSAADPAALLGSLPTGGNGSYNFQWESSLDSLNWNPIVTATGQNYDPPLTSVTTFFRRTVGSSVCNNTSNVVKITITAPITNNTISSSQTFCGPADPGTLTGAVLGGGNAAFTYQWESSTNGGITFTPIGGAIAATYSPGVVSTTTLFRRNVFSGFCSSTSNSVTITIVPVLGNNFIGTDQGFCGGGDASPLLGSAPNGGNGSYSFQWQLSADNGVTWLSIGGATGINFDPPFLSTTILYRRIVNSSACSDTSNPVTITIVPVITNNSIDAYQRFCQSGDAAVINGSNPGGGDGNYNFSWEVSTNNGISWSVVPGAGDPFYDPGVINVTTLYRRIVTSSVCSSTSNNSEVRILALPTFVSPFVAHTNVLCNGGNTGTITVNGNSTNGSIFFSIDSGNIYQASNSFSGLVAGDYYVFITDDSACTNVYAGNPETITEPAVLDHTTATVDASCANVFDGSITVSATGGTLPYSYSLNGGPGQPGNVFSGLAAGTYFISIYDANSCLDTSTVVINNTYTVTGNIDTIINVSCFGGIDGSVTVSLSGGIPPYSYSINGITFVNTPTFSNLSAGTYIITLRDSKGCSAFVSAPVTQPAQLAVQIDSVSNILCSGGSGGGIYISISGGTAPYTFTWSNGDTTEDVTGISAGVYNVTVVDAKGCSSSAGATISQPLPLFVTVASFDNLLCNGDSSGAVDITVSGGVPPYSFVWNTGSNFEDIQNLAAGAYDVTVTDANNCVQTLSQTITEPTVLTASITGDSVTCAGDADASIDFSISGGTPPYNYLWSNGATTEDLSNVAGGTYTVNASDANGCSVSRTFSVYEPTPLALSISSSTNVLCTGSSTGAIDLSVSGGTTAYTYLWSNGATTQDLSNLAAGTYTVTVTDANGCTASISATITQPVLSITGTAVATDVQCFGYNNGSVNLTVYGGTVPYIFNWSNGANTEDISNLAPAIYTVTVTDGNGCTFTAGDTVVEPALLAGTIVGTNVTCNGGNDGAADLTVTGGTTPYNYLWSTFDFTQDIDSLTAGNYVVLISDLHGCQAFASVVITEPAPMTISGAVTNVLCFGNSTGAINITVGGGNGTYTYIWSNGATTEDLTGLAAGTYSVTATDGNGCSAAASFTVTEPTLLVVTETQNNVSCNNGTNGSIDLTVSGGVSPYTYAWTGGASTQDLSGLAAGTYDVTVTDANGCVFNGSYTITEPAALTSSIVGTNVTCFGANNGSANLTVNGGTQPYSFLWSTFQNTEDISNLGAGTYYVIIHDANNCELRDSIIITEPAQNVVTGVVTNVTCFGASDGAIVTTVTGGVGPYTYLWSNGATTPDLTAIPAGAYSVTVTDANGCTASASFNVTQPTQLTLSASITDVNCNAGTDGAIDLSVFGGTPGYTYLWSGGAITQDRSNLAAGTYDVTVTDANLCTVTGSYTIVEPSAITSTVTGTPVTCNGAANGTATIVVNGGVAPYNYLWSNFQTTPTVGGLSGGTYFVIITDAHGCQHSDSITINEPNALDVVVAVTNISCSGANDGAIDLTVTGGTPNYTFNWSNGFVAEDIAGLSAGTYTCTITDANGCTTTVSGTVVNPAPLDIAAVVTNPNCSSYNDGGINLVVQGGTPGYTFNWSNGATTEDLDSIVGGIYDVTVTDANGCTAVKTITVLDPPPLYTSGYTNYVTCAGFANGSIDITVYGGTYPFSFNWSNGQFIEDIAQLNGGIYDITITDANGCEASASYEIKEPDTLTTSIVATNVNCFGGNSGSLAVIPAGGTPPFEYLWNNFVTDSFQLAANAGHYVVLVTDSNGCHTYDSIDITEPVQINITGVITNIACNGQTGGAVDITVTGGTGSYTYAWTGGTTNEDLSGVGAGTYTVTVTDGNGCQQTATFTITQSAGLFTNISVSQPTCGGSTTGFASITVNGGTIPYVYEWSTNPPQAGSTATNLGEGTYNVTVTDANGCSTVETVDVVAPASISVLATSTGSRCFNTANGAVILSVTGGIPPYMYEVNGVLQVSDTFSGLLPGTYVALARDANGCEGTVNFTVTSPSQIAVDLVANQYTILTGMEVTLQANIIPDTAATLNYIWSALPSTPFDFTDAGCGDPANCPTPLVAPTSTTLFTVEVLTADSCTATDTLTIVVNNEEFKFIPTAFTPNGDGLNDRFEFDILGANTISIDIYNRWGERVFSNPNQANGVNSGTGWDGTKGGKMCAFDTYVYQMKVTYFDGTEKNISGTVNLME
jgi:gliding motility-associated-like protein